MRLARRLQGDRGPTYQHFNGRSTRVENSLCLPQKNGGGVRYLLPMVVATCYTMDHKREMVNKFTLNRLQERGRSVNIGRLIKIVVTLR